MHCHRRFNKYTKKDRGYFLSILVLGHVIKIQKRELENYLSYFLRFTMMALKYLIILSFTVLNVNRK